MALIVAIVGVLLILGGGTYLAAHWLAWDPPFARNARHALGEANWRASNAWNEFADWVRLGR